MLVVLKVITTTNIGRDGGIRTRDPLHPMQVRYQAALRPDSLIILRAPLQATVCGAAIRTVAGAGHRLGQGFQRFA
jgi:hypothetical protein